MESLSLFYDISMIVRNGEMESYREREMESYRESHSQRKGIILRNHIERVIVIVSRNHIERVIVIVSRHYLERVIEKVIVISRYDSFSLIESHSQDMIPFLS